jgi:hypothetical protein
MTYSQNVIFLYCKAETTFMNHHVSLGFICLLLSVFLLGVCCADETSEYVAYIQGGESSLINGSDGMVILTINDSIPYFHILNGEKEYLVPVELLSLYKYPLKAAAVFSGADGESVSLIEVSNLSLSDGNKVLTLEVKPLKFYEGEKLKILASENSELDSVMTGKNDQTGIYLETSMLAIENTDSLPCCKDQGRCKMGQTDCCPGQAQGC